MIPILYEPTETEFTSAGLGALTDAESCTVTMDKNLMYELQMTYPINGELYGSIGYRSIIKAKPNQVDADQPFRVYRITKPIKGIVTIFARHISYDLSGIPVNAFTAASASSFAAGIKTNSLAANPFTFSTDVTEAAELKFDVPTSARAMLGGSDNSWQGKYGGDLVFDRYQVKLLQSGGTNRGVVIRYGLDLVDLQQEENIANVYTGIQPYWYDTQSSALVVGSIVSAPGSYDYTRILLVDVSQYIADTPDEAAVTAKGREWLAENPVHEPEVSLKLTYAQIDQTVGLYDPISVYFEKLGIEKTAKVSKVVYDVLKERNSSVEVGNVRQGIGADLTDASRLKKGLLPVERIQQRSIANEKMATDSVSRRTVQNYAVNDDKLADWAVIRRTIADKAVDTDQLEDEAVDTPKILGNAVTYDCLSIAVQQMFVDLLEANRIFAGVINSDGSVVCNSLVLNGHQLRGLSTYIDGSQAYVARSDWF